MKIKLQPISSLYLRPTEAWTGDLLEGYKGKNQVISSSLAIDLTQAKKIPSFLYKKDEIIRRWNKKELYKNIWELADPITDSLNPPLQLLGWFTDGTEYNRIAVFKTDNSSRIFTCNAQRIKLLYTIFGKKIEFILGNPYTPKSSINFYLLCFLQDKLLAISHVKLNEHVKLNGLVEWDEEDSILSIY